jgi:frataxin
MEKLKIIKRFLTESTYNALADKTIHEIYDLLEDENINSDLNYHSGIVTYKIKGIGEYVFNKQPPLHQIWISSPISGPKRFAVNDNLVWCDTKSKKILSEYIREEIESVRKFIGERCEKA